MTSTWSGSIPLLLETGGEAISGGYFSASAVLDVPSGATLTLAPGTIVKGQGPGARGGSISVEGSLVARGTSGSPITFTSINDNSVGGSTGSGSPAAGDWAGIQATGSGSIDLEHANISYTSTGVNAQTTGSALLWTVSIFDSSKAISDVQGDVSFRGQLGNDASGISSCDWGTAGCSVDAAYSYWGSPNGPPLGGQGGFVCGAVTTSPYLTSPGGSSTTPSGSAFGFGNCDGSQTPDTQLGSSAARFDQGIARLNGICGNDPSQCQDIQNQINTAQNCLGAANQLAQANFPIPVDTSGAAQAAGGQFVDKGSQYLASSSSRVVSDIGHVTGFAGQILGVASTIIGLAQAYNQCDPG